MGVLRRETRVGHIVTLDYIRTDSGEGASTAHRPSPVQRDRLQGDVPGERDPHGRPARPHRPFYEDRKWQADIAIERQWWIGRLAASLSTPHRAGSALAKKLAKLVVRYEAGINGTAAYLAKD
jgi:hypothetical protein